MHMRLYYIYLIQEKKIFSFKGDLQYVNIIFDEPVQNVSLHDGYVALKFQGGFAGSVCKLVLEDDNGEKIHETIFYPDDINDQQKFPINATATADSQKFSVKKIRIFFEKFTDFFGRLIVYNLEVILKTG